MQMSDESRSTNSASPSSGQQSVDISAKTFGNPPLGDSPPTTSGKNGGLSESKRVGIQNQLILILHAHKCAKRGALAKSLSSAAGGNVQPYKCKVAFCHRMQEVIAHLRTCNEKDACKYRSCHSTRQIILHWQTCSDEQCPVCRDVRMLATSAKPLFAKNERSEATENSARPTDTSTSNDQAKSDSEEIKINEEDCLLQIGLTTQQRESVRDRFVADVMVGALSTSDEERVRRFAVEAETEIYQKAKSRDDYFYMLAGKLYNGQKELLHTGGLAEAMPSETADCSICMQPVIPLACSARRLKCGHLFHMDCVNKWLQQKPNCPVCRQAV